MWPINNACGSADVRIAEGVIADAECCCEGFDAVGVRGGVSAFLDWSYWDNRDSFKIGGSSKALWPGLEAVAFGPVDWWTKVKDAPFVEACFAVAGTLEVLAFTLCGPALAEAVALFTTPAVGEIRSQP